MQSALFSNHPLLPLTGTVYLDSSSLIILARCDILPSWITHIPSATTDEVIKEINQGRHSDQGIINHSLERGATIHPSTSLPTNHHKLGRGELSLLAPFRKEEGALLLIDDGPMARYCFKNSLPFISSILTPLYLCREGAIGKKEALHCFKKVIRQGRYSREVIAFANRHFMGL